MLEKDPKDKKSPFLIDHSIGVLKVADEDLVLEIENFSPKEGYMVVEDLITTILKKRHSILEKSFRNKELRLEVYMEDDLWLRMVNEPVLGTNRGLVEDLYINHGKSIKGVPIHRVLTPGHGIKVFEVEE